MPVALLLDAAVTATATATRRGCYVFIRTRSFARCLQTHSELEITGVVGRQAGRQRPSSQASERDSFMQPTTIHRVGRSWKA